MKTGFTIIELIISIFILSIAIVGIFSAFSIVTILTSDTVDRLAATYLAQEGMEIVRNIRDTNWLNMDAGVSGVAWDNGFNSCEDKGCEVDYTTTGYGSNPVKPYASGHYLNIDANGFYHYQEAALNTKFKRKIIITKVTDVDNKDDHIIKVTVEVSWDRKATIINSGISAGTCIASNNNCIRAEETLYDWYNYLNH